MTTDVPELPAWLAAMLPLRRRVVPLSGGERIHCIDHGDPAAPVAFMVHGNPTWSFLWRGVIEALPELRCVAPDLLGLGLSSKLRRLGDHTVDRHADALAEVVVALGLKKIVLVGQDWGGPIAAAVGARLPERVAGVVIANTAVLVPARPRGTLFHRFARVPIVSDLAFRGFGFPQIWLGSVQGDRRSIRGNIARAYRWPLRRMADRIAPLALARMVPDGPNHPSLPALTRAEMWIKGFYQAGGPMAMVWGERDPILGRALKRHVEAFPKATVTRTAAGHFLQEEVPGALAAAVREVAVQAGMLKGA